MSILGTFAGRHLGFQLSFFPLDVSGVLHGVRYQKSHPRPHGQTLPSGNQGGLRQQGKPEPVSLVRAQVREFGSHGRPLGVDTSEAEGIFNSW